MGETGRELTLDNLPGPPLFKLVDSEGRDVFQTTEVGGANAQVMADGLDVILRDEQVKSVFVNVFGGITACDEVANGIKGALEILGDEATKPLVVRLDGNNVEKGREILEELNHPLVTTVDTMDGAADKAAELANK